MVVLCHTAETCSKEQPSRYTRPEMVEIYFFEVFFTSTTFRPASERGQHLDQFKLRRQTHQVADSASVSPPFRDHRVTVCKDIVNT